MNEQVIPPQAQPAQPMPPAAPPRWGRGAAQSGQRQAFDPRSKSPRLAAFLSAIPGLGQVYTGYYVRGFVIAATFLFMLMFASNAPSSLEPIPGFAAFFLWIFNVIDAGRIAALYNQALSGADSFTMPNDFKLPAMGGSIGGGGILLVFGLVALTNTLFGVSLEWLEYWWPIFPIALGGYLVGKGVMDRAAE
jgi:hypothetical protein